MKPKHPSTTQCFLDRALKDNLSFEAWDSALASDRLVIIIIISIIIIIIYRVYVRRLQLRIQNFTQIQ